MTTEHKPAQHVLVDRVDWNSIIQLPQLARAASIGLQPSRVVMGTILVVFLMMSGAAWDGISRMATGAEVGPFQQSVDLLTSQFSLAVSNLIDFDLYHAVLGVVMLPYVVVAGAWEADIAFTIVFGIWLLIVWCIGCGALTRSSACEFAIKQQIRWTEALAFSLSRWMSTVGAYAMPILLIVLALVLLGIGGLMLNVVVLDVIASVLYGLALLGSFVVVCVMLLSFFGGMLFIPAVAVESADAADALARAFSYVKNRPLHFILYGVLAILQGLVVFVMVAWLAAWAINFAASGAQFFLTSEIAGYAGDATLHTLRAHAKTPPEMTGTGAVTASIISFWRTIVAALVAGFAVSYLASAQTVLYFLMRRATDGQDHDEIWLPGMIEGTLSPADRESPGSQ